MYRVYKKYLFIMMFIFVSMGIERGLAFGELITLDAIENAGLYPGQEAYLRFVDEKNVNNVLLNVSPTDPQFTSASDVFTYAKGISGWLLDSAGNIWSAEKVVGKSLSDLPVGIYKVSAVGGAYMYNSFGWNDAYKDKYWWELHIKAHLAYQDGQIVDEAYYMLGSLDGKTSADLALQAVQGNQIEIPIAEGGSLSFWIWDWNSIDNSGSLSFNVADDPGIPTVPEPSTFLLLVPGLVFLIRRIKR